MSTLLRRPSSRDAAFERLYRRHVKDVYRYSLAVLGEQEDAEDVTQTTFLNAYRAFRRGERPAKPENWLIAIAHNVCRQRFRHARRRPDEVAFVDELDGAATDYEGPTAADLKRAFSQLPVNQREALVMRELEGRSYAEIAAILEITPSALETLIFRARRTLREQLDEQLSCHDASLAISKEADARLSPDERRELRAHLRACSDCARLASRQRALRTALKTVLAAPLPQSLASFFGGTGAAATAAGAGAAGVGLKAAVVLTTGALAAGGGTYLGVKHDRGSTPAPRSEPTRVRPADPVVTPRPTVASPIGGAKAGRGHGAYGHSPAHQAAKAAKSRAKARFHAAKARAKAARAPHGRARGHAHAARGRGKHRGHVA